MGERLSMANAAAKVAKEKRATPDRARKAIVAGLMLEKFTGCCESYWRDLVPAISGNNRQHNEHVQGDNIVPADFWRMDHAEHFEWDSGGGETPSGSWGCWQSENQSRFSTDIGLTGYIAAARYPDFHELADQGSATVILRWTAIGVTLHAIDIDRLINGGAIEPLIKRAMRRQDVRLGNVTKSDLEAVIAHFCVMSLSLSDQIEIARSPDKIVKCLEAINVNPDEINAVSDPSLRRFANQVAKAAGLLSSMASAPTI